MFATIAFIYAHAHIILENRESLVRIEMTHSKSQGMSHE